jgi:hypothetical protein
MTSKQIIKIIAPVIICYAIYFLTLEYFGSYFLQIPVRDIRAKNEIIANREVQKNFKFIILGDSSTAVSVMPKVLGQSAMNFSGWGTSSMDNYYVLRRYLAAHLAPECVLLSNSYNTDLHYKEKLWTTYIHTGFYSLEELGEIYKVSEVFKGYPSSEMSYFQFMFKGIMTKLKLSNLPTISFGMFNFLTPKPVNKYNLNVRKIADTRGFVGTNKKYSPNKEDLDEEMKFYKNGFNPFPAEDYYIQKILELSNAKKIKVIFLPAPMAKVLDMFNPEEYQLKFGLHLKKLMEPFHGTIYLEPIPVNGKHFSSLLHLSNEEAFGYSLRLKSQVKDSCTLE